MIGRPVTITMHPPRERADGGPPTIDVHIESGHLRFTAVWSTRLDRFTRSWSARHFARCQPRVHHAVAAYVRSMVQSHANAQPKAR